MVAETDCSLRIKICLYFHKFVLWVSPVTKQIISHCLSQSLIRCIGNILPCRYPWSITDSSCHIPSRKWYAIAEFFLFNDDSMFDVLFTADSLPHRMTVAGWSSYIGIPNIHSLNIRCSTSSIHCFKDINSNENALVSTVCCLLLIHLTGSLFLKRT